MCARESKSSKNNTHGAAERALLNRLRIVFSVSPKYLDNRSVDRTDTKFIFSCNKQGKETKSQQQKSTTKLENSTAREEMKEQFC